MDRTIGKSENRNNDGERLMISLFEIAKSVKERASTDTYNTKSIGREDGETWDHAKGFAAKHKGEIRYFDINDYPEDMSNDEVNAAAEKDAKAYAKTGKVANPKDAKKGETPEEPQGDKLSGSDFDRDGGDDKPDMDSDDGDEEKSAESENEKIINDLEKMNLPNGFNLDTPDSEIDGGRYGVITGKDDDPDNELSVNAITGEGGKVEYAINIGSGGTPIYFDSKEEAMEATKKLLDDATIRDSMNGESDPAGVTLADLDDHAKNVLKSDDDESKPIPAAGTEDDEPTHEEIMQYIEDEGYGGDAIGPDGNPTPEAYEDAKQELMYQKQNETITINGQKYRPIKEEKKKFNPRVLKEIYDRTFRSLK